MVNSVVIQAKLPKLRATRTGRSRVAGVPPPHPRSSLAAKKAVDARVICAKTRFALLPGHDVVRAKQNAAPRTAASLLGLAGILHRLKSREFDVVQFAVDLLDLADVDVLHDVAGFRIDRDRAARAFPLHALHRLDQRIAVGLSAGLLQSLVDQADAVIAADRHEAGARAESLLVGG